MGFLFMVVYCLGICSIDYHLSINSNVRSISDYRFHKCLELENLYSKRNRGSPSCQMLQASIINRTPDVITLK